MSARSRKTVCLQNGPPPGGRRGLWLIVGASGVLAAHAASADPQVVLPQGLPVQVKPTFAEPGLPQFTFPTAGGSLLGGSADVGNGNGAGDGSTSPGGGSTAGSGDAYNTMMAQSWGSSAASAAGAMGISATALAATCAMESNCQNVGAAPGGSATGAFQMIGSTYNADIKGAVAYDPSIAGTIVSGSAGEMDPATDAYAAALSCSRTPLICRTASLPSAIRRSLMCGRSINLAPARVPVSPPRQMTPILPNSRG